MTSAAARAVIEIIGSHDKERRTAKLERIRERNVTLDPDLMSQVGSIIDDVRGRGDAALIDYAARFDGYVMQASELRIGENELERIAANIDANVLEALREAISNVRRFHEHERQESWEIETEYGVRLGQRITPVERVGLYVPGGTASYPSSVVMNVVPAQVAGVPRIVVATPPRSLHENPAVAAALCQLGVSEVYAVGGAQAIAALAYGTKTVPRVDKITGPGNRYVAAAKKLVFGKVGIDSIANRKWIADRFSRICIHHHQHSGIAACDEQPPRFGIHRDCDRCPGRRDRPARLDRQGA